METFIIINQNNAKTGFSQYSEWLLATQSIASFAAKVTEWELGTRLGASLPTNGVCGEGRA